MIYPSKFVKNIPSLRPLSEATAFTAVTKTIYNLRIFKADPAKATLVSHVKFRAHFRVVQTYKVRDFRTFAFAGTEKTLSGV